MKNYKKIIKENKIIEIIKKNKIIDYVEHWKNKKGVLIIGLK
jgi:hypothetical protein